MKTRRLLALVLVTCMLLIAGCVHGTIRIVVNDDGSGDAKVTIVMEKQAVDQLAQFGTTDPFEQARASFAQKGYKVADAKTSDGTGFSAAKHLDSVEGDVIPKLITEVMQTAEQTATPRSKPASGTMTIARALTADEYAADISVPAVTGELASYEYIIQMQMPGEAGETNAPEKVEDGQVLQWKLGSTAATSVKAASTVPQSTRLIVVVVGILLLLGVAVAAVFFLMKGRKKTPPDAPPADAAPAPVDAPAPAEMDAPAEVPAPAETPTAVDEPSPAEEVPPPPDSDS